MLAAAALAVAACAPTTSPVTSSTETAEAPADPTTLPEADPENGSDDSGDESQIIEARSSLALPLASEPVLLPVANERFVNPGAMVEHEGRLEVFANSFSAFPGPSVVHRWTSGDGLNWTLSSDEPILTSDDVPYTAGNAFLYSVDVTDDGWVGWFYTYEGLLRTGVIGRATAPAPEGPWTVDPEPVLLPGEDDAWDGGRLTEPSVVRDGDGYLMLYGGRDRSENSAIGLATSPDGINWTKADGPVVSPDGVWDSNTIARPRVIARHDGWLLVYAAVARATGSVGIATSADGVNWSPYPDNPILTRGDLPGSLFQYGVVPIRIACCGYSRPGAALQAPPCIRWSYSLRMPQRSWT